MQPGLAVEDFRGLIHMRRAGTERAGGCWWIGIIPLCHPACWANSAFLNWAGTPLFHMQCLSFVLCIAPGEVCLDLEVVLPSWTCSLGSRGCSWEAAAQGPALCRCVPVLWGYPKSVGKPESHSLVPPLRKHNHSIFPFLTEKIR